MSATARQERPTWLVWLDLETTGTDEQQDPIMELGYVITDEALTERAWANLVISDPATETRFAQANAVVQEMHTSNGLIDDIRSGRGSVLPDAEGFVIDELQGIGKKHDFVLAGSGVSHFDRRFLEAQMPHLMKWLRYYSIDVGVLRRSLELIGRTDALLPRRTRHTAR
jgi:oligoribonuclease